MTLQHLQLIENIYSVDILLAWGGTKQDLGKICVKRWPKFTWPPGFFTEKSVGSSFIACTDGNAVDEYVIWIQDPRDLDTRVHEVVHLAYNILTAHGIDLGPETIEVYCYYQEALFRSIGIQINARRRRRSTRSKMRRVSKRVRARQISRMAKRR